VQSAESKSSISAHHSSLITHHCVVVAALLAAALSGCGTVTKREPTVSGAPPTTAPRGGYYLDDGPADIDGIPDAVPQVEPLHRGASRPYVVMGRSYMPMTALAPYKARGIATWYGRRDHGRQTSMGEIYDMYAMTAAHPTLPIPSYARVTNLKNGRSVVVRVNDRGPFLEDRLIDLSYTAAHRLGILAGGNAMVEVEAIIPGEGAATAVASGAPRRRPPAPAEAAPSPATGESVPASDKRETVPPPAPPPADEPATVASTVPAPQLPLTSDASGFYLQLGAFGSRENAESFLARLKAQVDWLALHIFPRDGFYRIHAGPYSNALEARQIADRISQALGIRPMLLTR
jgi:rare lipoprotein A